MDTQSSVPVVYRNSNPFRNGNAGNGHAANGNGHAGRLKVERGASLAKRKLSKSQRAVIGADILDGLAVYQPTRRAVAANLGVSSGYVARAQALSPDQRKMVREGRIGLNRIASARRARSGNGAVIIDDIALTEIVRAAGIDRVLTVASTVERMLRDLHQ
jgi:hypothetical protein